MAFYFPFSRYHYFSYAPHDFITHSDKIKGNWSNIITHSDNIDKKTNPIFNNNCTKNTDDSKEGKNHITKNSNTISNLFSFGPLNFNFDAFNDIEQPIFEMFGIKLYIDDIIIICVLIFLYQEGVKDDLLYICLFLLLIL